MQDIRRHKSCDINLWSSIEWLYMHDITTRPTYNFCMATMYGCDTCFSYCVLSLITKSKNDISQSVINRWKDHYTPNRSNFSSDNCDFLNFSKFIDTQPVTVLPAWTLHLYGWPCRNLHTHCCHTYTHIHWFT